ncbi:helix-turn-helix transcriptional regulator [Providencia rettgeri]|uniref:helix-turn-helix transcriptional regulator n=1 Tax=Providencia rettgeri TaxID=587 RepID=UPI0015EC8134|nr:AraC family transcriptional regulator [Providencia rettgeri]QLR06114.1 helix-turn-helix transcriptional regulator [Providencia rettgeri]
MNSLNEIIKWIENHLDSKMTSEDVARKSGYTSRHLYSKFKKSIGISVASYIRLRKLTQASYMLRRSGRPITEIAFMYGFDSLQHFSRLFKNHFGLSPRAFRNAESWNMSLFYPSVIVSDFNYRSSVIYLKNYHVSFEHEENITIDYGFNFLVSTYEGNIIISKNLEEHYIPIFKNILKVESSFTILGDIIPMKGSDAEIKTYIGKISNKNTSKGNYKKIPPSKYICFKYSGSLKDIMAFHSWASGHGLHKHKCILQKGPTFSTFLNSNEPDIFILHHYIPII